MSVPPAATILQLVQGYRAAQLVYMAAKLGLADLLGDGAKSAAVLAAATGTDAPTLRRLLRALASIGVVAEDDGGDFRMTPAGTCLRGDVSGSLRPAVLFLMSQDKQRAWAALEHSVATGATAFDHVFGMPVFDFYAAHPEAEISREHDGAMAGLTSLTTDAILGAYDFASLGTIVDVGGGNGAFLAAILRANPRVRGVLFDLPHVVAGAPEVLAGAGVAERCAVVAGSFFDDPVPEGGDAYLLKRIIHDWDDDRSRAILAACRRAMRPGARLLLVDEVLPRRAEPGPATAAFLLDMEMLVATPGGRERTEEGFRALLRAAGFSLSRVVPAARTLSVVEGLPD